MLLSIPVIACVTLVVAFSFLGARGIYEETEGRYAECGREMLATGHWLEPTLAGKPHWTKPPLEYWLVAGGIRLLGANEAGVRFGGAVSFCLTVIVVGLLGARLFGRDTGRLAAVVYATSPFPAMMAWGASPDTPLTLFETLAVLCLLHAARSTARSWAWATAGWIALGLAFFTKGPVALIALVPILAIGRLQVVGPGEDSHSTATSGKRLHVIPILLGGVVAASWYLFEGWRHPGLIGHWFRDEVWGRVLGDSDRNSRWYKPLVIYGPVLLLGTGVWMAYGFFALRDRLRASERLWPSDVRVRWLLLWVFLPLVALSLSKSRLPLYVLPLLAPIAILLAHVVQSHAIDDRTSCSLARGSPAGSISRLAFGSHAASHGRAPWARSVAAAPRWVWVALGSVVLVLFGKGIWSGLEDAHDMRRLSRFIDEVHGDALAEQMERQIWESRIAVTISGRRRADVAHGSDPVSLYGDMHGRLWHPVVGTEPVVMVYRREKMHGLAFYRDGLIERFTETGNDEWADHDLSSAVRLLRSSRTRPVVLVSREQDADDVREMLIDTGAAFVERQDTDWVVFARSE